MNCQPGKINTGSLEHYIIIYPKGTSISRSLEQMFTSYDKPPSVQLRSNPVIPEEMEAKRNASGCRLGATGSYGDESSMSPPETTVKMTKIRYHSSG